MSRAVTDRISVTADPAYVPERSDPREGRFFFSYHIRITNDSDRAVRLISRQWLVVDGLAQREVVKGMGVVGEQPRLEPGQTFEYTSYCPLSTPTGSMEGRFEMIGDDGSLFWVHIDRFFMFVPAILN